MTRLKNRPGYFFYRGVRFAHHRLQDGPTLARLDPYCVGEQHWLLHSGHAIEVTGEEVRDITRQVNGTILPDSRPIGEGGDWDEARIRSIEERLDALEATQGAPSAEPTNFDAVLADTIEANPSAASSTAPDPRDAELESLRAENARLREASARDGEGRIDPNAKLADQDFVGVFPVWLNDPEHIVEGETIKARIARLSVEFKARVNELTNKLLAGKIEDWEDVELTTKQAKYNELIELGDRS